MNPQNNSNPNLSQAIIVAVYALALFLLVGIVLGIKFYGTIGEGINPTNTINVSGTGNAFAVPDIATVDFDVTAEAAQVADAQTQVTNQANAVLAWLKGEGIADADVKTTNYSIEPHYVNQSESVNCPMIANVPSLPSGATVSSGSSNSTVVYCPSVGNQVLTGYDVTDSIEVTIRNISQAGAILAGLGSQKVSNLNGLNFSVDNPDSVEAQARATAITDAKTKAQTLANQLGVHLGPIVSFSENGGGPIYEPMMLSASAGSANGAGVPTPAIPAGQNEVTSNVTITYQID